MPDFAGESEEMLERQIESERERIGERAEVGGDSTKRIYGDNSFGNPVLPVVVVGGVKHFTSLRSFSFYYYST